MLGTLPPIPYIDVSRWTALFIAIVCKQMKKRLQIFRTLCSTISTYLVLCFRRKTAFLMAITFLQCQISQMHINTANRKWGGLRAEIYGFHYPMPLLLSRSFQFHSVERWILRHCLWFWCSFMIYKKLQPIPLNVTRMAAASTLPLMTEILSCIWCNR